MADDDSPVEPPQPGDEPPFNPFSAMPMFSELAKQLQGQGPISWDAARQFAMLGATGTEAEPNVDPAARIALAELAQIVGPQVNDVGGTDIVFPEPRTLTRSQWASDTLTAYRPLFTDLATSLSRNPEIGTSATDPLAQMMANLNQMAAPGMLGMAVGSMIGSLSQRVFGTGDLPIPRPELALVVVPANIEQFARDWELSLDEVRLWVLAQELAGYALFSIEPVRTGLADLVSAHVAAFKPDPNALGDKLGSLDPVGDDPMEAIQRAFSDPEILLGAVASDAQRALQPGLDAAVAAVIGYVDWVVDGVAVRLIGGDALTIAEAARRRRAESVTKDAFVQRLLGIRVDHEQVRRGKEFVQGVVDRVGEDGLSRLLNAPGALPTPNELEAPGLWVERVQTQQSDP